MANIDRELLRTIPHIAVDTLAGRTLTTTTFFVAGEWQLWFVAEDGRPFKLVGEPIEDCYLADTPAREDDIHVQLMELLVQRLSFQELVPLIFGIRSDIFNLGASFAKLELLYHVSQENGTASSRMVMTEMEYIFILCRSLFDLLQTTVSAVFSMTQFDRGPKVKTLPKSWAQMTLRSKVVVTSEELQERFHLPQEFGALYTRHASFFLRLRQFRDMITHSGKSFEVVFVTERGFALFDGAQPFKHFGVWNDSHKLKNGLSSLLAALGYLVNGTLLACEDFAETLAKYVNLPPPVSPGLGLFLRGYHNRSLLNAIDAANQCLWWDQLPFRRETHSSSEEI